MFQLKCVLGIVGVMLVLAGCGDSGNGASDFSFVQFERKPVDATETLFTQVAQSGTYAPIEGAPGRFRLHLNGVMPYTVAFSNRPGRDVSRVDMTLSANVIGFDEENPPNAAIVVTDQNGDPVVVVAELGHPLYSADDASLEYDLTILEEADGSLAEFNDGNETELPASFGAASLFIDDCPDRSVACMDGQRWNEMTGNQRSLEEWESASYAVVPTGTCFGWSDTVGYGCMSWNCFIPSPYANATDFGTAADAFCASEYEAGAIFVQFDPIWDGGYNAARPAPGN